MQDGIKVLFFENAWEVGIWCARKKHWIIYKFEMEEEALKFYHRQ